MAKCNTSSTFLLNLTNITPHRECVNRKRKKISNVNSFATEKEARNSRLSQTRTASFNMEVSELYQEQLNILLVYFPQVINHSREFNWQV